MVDSRSSFPPDIKSDRPTVARVYDYGMGGKDNFAVDREAGLQLAKTLPFLLDVARENRMFLYRAVRYLAQEANIRQFIDMGSGLPTELNVHEVAQGFQPEARVVYIDIDPIVLAHGRALLADNSTTTVINANMADSDAILADPDLRALIDFSEPVGLLYFSVLHCLTDEEDPKGNVQRLLEPFPSGSAVAMSHLVSEDVAVGDQLTNMLLAMGPWGRVRRPAEVREFVEGLEAVEPGLVDVAEWRPDPDQPQLTPPPEPLQPYLGKSLEGKGVWEMGGVLVKP